jgi:hypothetical protein
MTFPDQLCGDPIDDVDRDRKADPGKSSGARQNGGIDAISRAASSSNGPPALPGLALEFGKYAERLEERPSMGGFEWDFGIMFWAGVLHTPSLPNTAFMSGP